MKHLLLLALLALPALGCTVEPQAVPTSKTGDEPPVTRAAECRWSANIVRIDGVINEKDWARAEPIKNFAVYWQKRKALTPTVARLMWDDRFLYFMAEMEDEDLFATVTEHNGMTWYDDVFELFLKPPAKKNSKYPLHYYEFQVNPRNTRLELFLPSRGGGGYARFAQSSKLGMETAVKLRGTLNDWTDRDKGWTVEGKIPWTAFKEAGGKPKFGDVWKFALCRYDYSVALERTELSSTAPLTAPDFHRYEEFGDLKFVAPE